MNVKVKKMSFEESILEVETRSGVKELVIKKEELGHSYSDFADWDITDNQYYELENFLDDLIEKMSGRSELSVSWD